MLRLMEVYGYQSFTTANYQNLLEWLHLMAMQTEQGIRRQIEMVSATGAARR